MVFGTRFSADIPLRFSTIKTFSPSTTISIVDPAASGRPPLTPGMPSGSPCSAVLTFKRLRPAAGFFEGPHAASSAWWRNLG